MKLINAILRKKPVHVFTYDMDYLRHITETQGGLANDDSIAIAEGFCNLLCFMAGVADAMHLPKQYLTDVQPGNMVRTINPNGFGLVDIMLTGCDVGEFLTSAQVYLAGLGDQWIWAPMTRPSYWRSIEQYNAWSDHTNPVIQQSVKED